MIPFRLALAGLAAVAVLSIAAWLVHVSGDSARGEAERARADGLQQAEEARRAADRDAGAAGAADWLRRDWQRD